MHWRKRAGNMDGNSPLLHTTARLERVAFVGNYIPRQCGIATFTYDLCESVAEALPGTHCFVGAVNDRRDGYAYPPRVRFEFQEKELDSYRRAADFLNINNVDVVCVQHEFGIYGGPAGSHLLALLRDVRMPVVTTLHTVLKDPTDEQREVMLRLNEVSDRFVVMNQRGEQFLQEIYDIPQHKIDLIPHGIPDVPFIDPSFFKDQFGVEGKTVLLTFGLLSPGKGIEYAIEALPRILEKHPNVVYIVLGATHPNLVAREGETYRLQLERLAEARGVKDNVIFYNRFVAVEELKEFIGAADIYITPYLNPAQIVSGTLSYSFGAGKAVISTPYWHAEELLGSDRGALVPFRDAGAIADAVIEYLDNPTKLTGTRKAAYMQGREMIWPVVAERYLESFRKARSARTQPARRAFGRQTLASRPYQLPPVKLDHIVRMTDRTGILQHAVYNVPNYHEGYCTDDNSRAFMLAVLLEELDSPEPQANMDYLASTYLAFLWYALDPQTGRFRNFMSHNRRWLEKKGSEDSHARALWAAGTALGRSPNEGHRKLCSKIFEHALPPVVDHFTSPRAWAFTLLAIHEYLRRFSGDRVASHAREVLTDKLLRLHAEISGDDWPWFESIATYDNARLSQALLLSGHWIPNSEALDVGLKSLRWLAECQTSPEGYFCPIGCNGFFPRGQIRAEFDQQPLEAYAMVSASLEAWRITRDEFWWKEAQRAFEWFLGRNHLNQPLYDSTTGGCRDAIHEDRINENQGAESTLAFQLALAEMRLAQHMVDSQVRKT
ncbi:glycosyltransferase family 4 protein [Verrucomicrobiota bacterium sgz303538]